MDSAVSAALLKKAGYQVVGVFMRTWHPDFLECNEEEERRDAMRVAARLGIPFLTFDFEEVYKKEVADYMIREYRAGRTPNPDAMCNKEVKFGAFLKKALALGADFVATGHYARTGAESTFLNGLAEPKAKENRGPEKKYSPRKLLKGIDALKDQSYFLWTLSQNQLSKIIFPVGNLKKTEVRKLAKKFALPVAEKKDSQGICFLGPVDLKEFLAHYIKPKRGKVLNEAGQVIGYHDGVTFHTLGERHGFTITKKTPNDKPYYIVGKDIKKNILTVSQDKNHFSKSTNIPLLRNFSARLSQPAQGFYKNDFYLALKSTNWISSAPEKGKKYTAQIRYHGEFLPCRADIIKKSKTARLIFDKPVLVAPGQSVVLYDGNVCLGGGTVV